MALAAMTLLVGAGAMPLTHPAQAQTATSTDYDTDDDGLIEVGDLAQLDAIRYDLDGDGTPASANASDYSAAFSNAVAGMGCPAAGCTGYELTVNLDFDTNGDGRTDIAGDTYWNGGAGWDPIGTFDFNGSFSATFEGNGNTISGLFIDRSATDYVGLFGIIGLRVAATVRNVGLTGVDVTGNEYVGGLTGNNRVEGPGTIIASYAEGTVSGGRNDVGGLVGRNGGTITASYAAVTISGNSRVGGLVGANETNGGTITASYAVGTVSGSRIFVGGLVGANFGAISAAYATGAVSGGSVGGLGGFNSGTITASYWDTETSGLSTSAGGEGKTTSDLQSPTSNTGIYATWDDDVWDFGTSTDYPNLKGVGPVVSPVDIDRSALVALYNATDGANWSDNTNWLSDEPLGDWFGVTTDSNGRVTSLNIWLNNLTGAIPSQLGSLSNLTALEFTDNQLTGPIPAELGNLSNLESLALGSNDLTGNIPSELGSLSNLTELSLSSNDLTGTIPSELGSLSNLTSLSLGRNDLTGAIPSQLGSLSNLESLWLGDNQLTGAIPAELGSLSNLDYLGLESNALTDAIPTELGNLSSLTWLALNGNQLTGALPQSFTNLTALDDFAFTDNAGLCAPADAAFQTWLQGISNSNITAEIAVPFGPNCSDPSGGPTDYDADDDGLIEVGSLAQLDAIRYDLDGDGSSTNSTAYDAAFPNAAPGMGCPSSGCTGYELIANLDFDTNGDGRTDIAGDTYWNGGAGWLPIGRSSRFSATFEGNNHTIANLYINRGAGDLISQYQGIGLFGNTGAGSVFRRVGLVSVNVTGYGDHFVAGSLAGRSRSTITESFSTGNLTSHEAGGLVGYSFGAITRSYSAGSVTSNLVVLQQGSFVGGTGGLVGHNEGTITDSYSASSVSSNFSSGAGGLVGANQSGGAVSRSYAAGKAAGNAARVGGLIGSNTSTGPITTSYWNTQTSGQSTSNGGEGKTTAELQSPTSKTGIYATWDNNVWDFGTSTQYPALKGLGIGVAEQRQSHPAPVSSPPGAPTIGTVTPGTGTLAVSWTAPSSDGGAPVTAYDLRHIETSADETVDSNWTVIDDIWTTGGGMLQHTLTGLTGGTQYDLQVRAVNNAGDGPWSATVTGTPTTATDYDADDNGLIEVGSLAQLDAIRWDLDGNGTPASANASAYGAAFPNAASGMGCPSSGCTGYELTTNLDFDTNGDGKTDIAGDIYWNGGAGWEPIGTGPISYSSDGFTATFDGNGYTISSLFIGRSATDYVGLFGAVAGAGVIQNVGLTDVDVTGGSGVGGLAGENGGRIVSSYAAGTVSGQDAGGLVGKNLWNDRKGIIVASYATGAITGTSVDGSAGGLVGHHSGRIITSYAAGTVTDERGREGGGLVGSLEIGTLGRGRIFASYWDRTTNRGDGVGGEGKTTAEIQSPTGYTGIYADWNVDLDGDGTGDDPWDFGTSSQYPVLKVFAAGVDEPRSPGASAIGSVTPGVGSLSLSWTAPSSDGGSAITAYDLRHIETSADETVDSNWTVMDDVWTTGGGTFQYTLTGLTGGTQYDIQVRAVNAAGDGPWSATATGTPASGGSCATGSAVPNAANNPGLVSDCETLLAARDTLAGTATLKWAASTPMSQWTGVTVAGTPQRVTRLSLLDMGLTGTIPSQLGDLTNLERLDLGGNQLTGCIPANLRAVSNNDLDDLDLPYCDVLLSGLSVSPGSLVPAFDPYRTAYSASVGLSPVTVTVSPTSDHNATVRFLDENDRVLADADRTTAGFQVAFGGTVPAVKIRVTSQDGQATRTYVVTDVGEKYDANDDGAIDRDEVVSAIKDYFSGAITREEAFEIIKLYFVG